jgi:hypothetical protein
MLLKWNQKYLLSHYKDLFRTRLLKVNTLENIRSVVILLPGATILNISMFRFFAIRICRNANISFYYVKTWLITKSVSTFSAPVLFVKEKIGDLHIFVDNRTLNKVIASNRYPLPRIDDLLVKMQGTTVF